MKKSFLTKFLHLLHKKIQKARLFFSSFFPVLDLSLRGFVKDECSLKASSLTYYTFLSLVPSLAICFAIAKGMGLYELLEKDLMERWAEYQQGVNQIFEFANKLLDNTKGGVLAFFGSLLLFFSVMTLLSRIEDAFYSIWQEEKKRKWKQRFSHLLALFLLLPAFLISSVSMKVWIFRKLAHFLEGSHFSFILSFTIQLMPYLFVWSFLTFFYLFLPKSRVKFLSAFIGAVIAGTIYELIGWGYIYFQVGVSNYGAIYGSFAALPLFLIYVQLVWMVFLLGGEISFAFQHRKTATLEKKVFFLSAKYISLLSLWLTRMAIEHKIQKKDPLTTQYLEEHFHLPSYITKMIVSKLVEAGFFEVKEGGKKDGNPFILSFIPDMETLKVCDVLEAIDRVGLKTLPLKKTPFWESFKEILDRFEKKLARAEENRLLKDFP
jgi:membrane protein